MKKLLLFLLLPVALFAVGQAGYNLSFDGTDDLVLVSYQSVLNTMSGNYTIEAWINRTAYSNYDRIADRDGVFAFYLGPNNTFGFRGPLGSPVLDSPNNTVTAGWHHVAVRCINNSGVYTATLLYDGNPVATLTDASLNLPVGTTNNLYLGNRGAGDRPFNGQIDEVRFWNTARTDAVIRTNRGARLVGNEIGLLAYYKMDETSGQVSNDATLNNLDGQLGTTAGADANDPIMQASTAPVGFNLLSPNGPGTLNMGAPLTVTWAVNPAIPQVNVLFSSDGGTKWIILGFRVPNNGAFNTFVPSVATTVGLFRVANPDVPADFDNSDNVITIVSAGFVVQTIVKEAEAGVLADRLWTSVDGHAFGCEFVFSKKENVGTCDIQFNVATTGLYVIWVRTRAVGGSANSFFWRMDGGAERIMDTKKNDAWNWEKLSDRGNQAGYPDAEVRPVVFNLTAGSHTFRYRARETHCRLDQIKITNDLSLVVNNRPGAWLELTSPVGGQKITRGTTHKITWKSYGCASTVCIQYSYGRQFLSPVTIATNVPNNGSYLWHVQNDTCPDAFIRVTSGSIGNCPADQNHNEFMIVDPEPTITVLAPNGHEKWLAKTSKTISWLNTAFAQNVDVFLSFNNGLTWKTIANNLINSGTFTYTVPDTSADSCLVKVADHATGAPMDKSDHAFTIYPEIKVTAPNGGEKIQASAGSSLTLQNVSWTTQKYTGLVNVFVSLNNGKTWSVIAENLAGSGNVNWIVPVTTSDSCLIKVAGVNGGLPTDQSDAVFAIIPHEVEPPPVTDDYALSFDGAKDYVEIAHSPTLNVSTKFTIEFWMKTAAPAQKWNRILEKGSWDEYYVGFYGNSGKMSGALRTAIPGGSAMTTPAGPSTTVLVKDKWQHVAVTYDGAIAKIFINGVEETSKSATAVPRSLVNALILGAKKSPVGTEYHYQGVLDELRIWNVARSKTEITTNMYKTLTGAEANLAAYYTFNEGAGQVAGDKTANANHGRLGNLSTADDADPAWVLSDKPTTPPAATAFLAKEAAEEIVALPQEYALAQNYPNPFNAGTTIIFDIPAQKEETEAVIEIYDLSGRVISTLWRGTAQPGHHQVYWNGQDNQGRMTASGVYFYRLRVGNYSETKRMVMLK